jgi:hypothetical protein
MNFWETWLQTGRVEIAIAGLIGSAVHVVMEWQGYASGLRRLFVGAAAALFMSPVGIPIFQKCFAMVSIPPEHAAGFGGFVTGVSGVIIIEIFINSLKLMKKEGRIRHDQG